MLKKVITGVLALIILVPFMMWLFWIISPKQNLIVAIIDKTVITDESRKHNSLTWILNQERYTKTPTKSYKKNRDYFGFFPMKDEKFAVKGLERFSTAQLNQLSLDADLVYFADTYGITNNEWYSDKNPNKKYGILYGGLSNRDIELIQMMKARKKLIIAEFNTFGSPTDSLNRSRFEKSFGIKWSGWTARFFYNLDTTVNREIPPWLIHNYKKTHRNEWPFKKSGIAFVSDLGQVTILEDGTHLNDPMPYIISSDYGKQKLSLPKKTIYPFWFDIVSMDEKINKSAATFEINSNKKGLEELKIAGIPAAFPAITYHEGEDYSFYYFSGDFCDSTIPQLSGYFNGISVFKSVFYSDENQNESSSFFWNFYRPMLTNILKEQAKKKRIN